MQIMSTTSKWDSIGIQELYRLQDWWTYVHLQTYKQIKMGKTQNTQILVIVEKLSYVLIWKYITYFPGF